jgi:hypothetical protein
MSRFSILIPCLLLATAARAEPFDLRAPALDAGADVWAAFSENLVVALKSDNLGVQCSALQHVAAYGGDRVDVRGARFEVVRLFRDHPDKRVRMSALAALTQLDDPWVTDFLFRSARFEREPRLAQIYLHAAIASHERTR